MAHPKRRHSNSRTRTRRSHDFLKTRSLATCANCKRPIASHQICTNCGYYRGRQVVTIKAKEKETPDKR